MGKLSVPSTITSYSEINSITLFFVIASLEKLTSVKGALCVIKFARRSDFEKHKAITGH